MAGIFEVQQLFDKKLRYARVLGLGRFIDSKQKHNYYLLQILNKYGEVEFYRTQITYKGGDVQVEGNIKQGDTLKLEILDEYSARYVQIDAFKVEVVLDPCYECTFYEKEYLQPVSVKMFKSLDEAERYAERRNLTFVSY